MNLPDYVKNKPVELLPGHDGFMTLRCGQCQYAVCTQTQVDIYCEIFAEGFDTGEDHCVFRLRQRNGEAA